MLISITSQAQDLDLAGRKIVSANLVFTTFIPNESNVSGPLALQTNVLIGKIKDDNTYWAFGGQFQLISNSTVDNSQSVGPAAEHGKFIKLVDRFYVVPAVGGNVSAKFSESSTFGMDMSLYATPLRFMYHFGNNFMAYTTLGSASLSLTSTGSGTLINLQGGLRNSGSLGVFYTFK